MKIKNRCFALFSGGLDSMLAVIHMHKLGYEVIPIFFETPFFRSKKAQEAAESIGFELMIHDLTDQHLEMLHNPRYGFGKNMNPCIDCHGLMFKTAGELMKEYNIDFLISGEVLGQRPMSQRKDAMNSVGKLSDVKDLLIRPLCQKLIADTKPIRENWVDKDNMLDIQGRSRHRQIAMAKEYGIEVYQNPGGGCLLTDIGYSRKLKDLMDHEMLDSKCLQFLQIGRHLRINENFKMIIGRNNEDNENLGKLCTNEIVFQTADFPGPLGVVQAKQPLTKEEIQIAASLVLRYNSKIKKFGKVNYGLNFNLENPIQTEKMNSEEVEKLLI
jgi:tRNA-uridine 2-sulfurtransferase